jgi:Transposase DDE domain group 1
MLSRQCLSSGEGLYVKENSTTECLLFPDMFGKAAVMQFDQRQGSSDGGAILLKGAEKRYGLIEALSDSLRDKRQSGKVDHSLQELIAQRVFSLACGYPDANDAARLAGDPIYKMLLDRDPVKGLDLASQATLSRFENAVGVKELYRFGEALASKVIERHSKRLGGRARRVTIDLDPTDDPTHGAQQLSFFNGYYDNSCYLPMMGFVSFNDEADQYLCAAVLRPGNVTAAAGAIGILRRLIGLIRSCFPAARIRVRLDSGFAHPKLLQFLDSQPGVEYVVAMSANQVLDREAEPAMQQVRLLAQITEQTEHLYDETYYAANSWSHKRRIIIKAEVVRNEGKQAKDNPRFVITNMKQTPSWLYERVYCQRGEIENRIKELHDLEIDRTSCSQFWANQFRVLLTAAAYVLLQEIRLQAAGTDCARSQVWTLRERFLKLGARVTASVRRMVIHLPISFPFLSTFHHLAVALGASPG